jgi:hypothetical protein
MNDKAQEMQNSDNALLEAELANFDVTADDGAAAAPSGNVTTFAASSPTRSDHNRSNRRIPGGLSKLTDDLGVKARDMKHVVMLLEQQRPQIDAAEVAQDRLQEEIDRVYNRVKEGTRSLKTMLDAAKAGDLGADVAAQFVKNGKMMDELENAVGAMASNHLWLRSVWEQHVQTVQVATKLKDDLRH